MLRNHSESFSTMHKMIDMIIVLFSWAVSYFFRFKTIIPETEDDLGLWYLKVSIVLVILSYYYFRREGVYSSKRFENLFNELMSVVKANTVAFSVFVFLIYFFIPHKASRILLFIYFITSTTLLVTFKIIVRKFLRRLREQGKNIRYALLVGSGKQIQDYAIKLYKHKEVGIKIIGWVDSEGSCENLGIKCYKNFTKKFFRSINPDIVIIGYKNKDAFKVEEATNILMNSLAETIVLPDLSHSLVGYSINEFHGIPMIMLNEPSIKSRSMIIKRMFDFVFSFLGIILLSPMFIIISIIVKLGSKGPVFYSQERMGIDGRRFKMFKFRSMSNDVLVNTEGWTVKNDSRVTPVGKFLRKTSLDEFPQLWNVLLGSMSLVGPRPERPKFVEKFREDIPTYMLRHKMKAGMTGWAQINGWRGDTSIEKRIECDLYYIKNWSIWMDITIIAMTFWKGFFNKNAY